jgi:hypothetical protein
VKGLGLGLGERVGVGARVVVGVRLRVGVRVKVRVRVRVRVRAAAFMLVRSSAMRLAGMTRRSSQIESSRSSLSKRRRTRVSTRPVCEPACSSGVRA